MKKIKYFILLFLLVSFPYLSLSADDPESRIAVTNGGSLENSGGQYKNSLSINEGMVVNQKSLDYRLDSGLLASIMISNPDIVFYDFIPSSSDTISTADSVRIGVTVHTDAGSIKRIGYRVSQTPPTNESAGNFNYLYIYQTGTAANKTVTVSTIVAGGFQPGLNYLQWYAQNSVDEDGNTTTQIVNIGESDRYVNILQPRGISSAKPQIQAKLYSPYGFGESSVTIKMCKGESTGTVIHTESGAGKFTGVGILNYKYTGQTLLSGGRYTVWIELADSSGTISSTSTFEVSDESIADLLPYPSPYNPKKGDMTIRFVIADQASVTINIYDRAGKLVSSVIDSISKSAGENKISWNGRSYAGDSLANGIYICEIITKSGGKENKRYKSFAILRK